MNKIRRKKLAELTEKLNDLRADLEEVFDEESEARDNIPESLMGSERYEAADEACYNLEAAMDSIQEAIDGIEQAME